MGKYLIQAHIPCRLLLGLVATASSRCHTGPGVACAMSFCLLELHIQRPNWKGSKMFSAKVLGHTQPRRWTSESQISAASKQLLATQRVLPRGWPFRGRSRRGEMTLRGWADQRDAGLSRLFRSPRSAGATKPTEKDPCGAAGPSGPYSSTLVTRQEGGVC